MRITEKMKDGHFRFLHFTKYIPRQVIADHVGNLESKLEKLEKSKGKKDV